MSSSGLIKKIIMGTVKKWTQVTKNGEKQVAKQVTYNVNSGDIWVQTIITTKFS